MPMQAVTTYGGGSMAATCAACGNVFMADSNFCRKCGAKRGATVAAAAPPAIISKGLGKEDHHQVVHVKHKYIEQMKEKMVEVPYVETEEQEVPISATFIEEEYTVKQEM